MRGGAAGAVLWDGDEELADQLRAALGWGRHAAASLAPGRSRRAGFAARRRFALRRWSHRLTVGRVLALRAFYDQHRAAGDLHHQALRALGNRLVGILHGCLRHHTTYSENTAWAHRQTSPTTHAA